nr:hypothetical protein [Tanacetum cinerariifolium]
MEKWLQRNNFRGLERERRKASTSHPYHTDTGFGNSARAMGEHAFFMIRRRLP